MKCNIIKDFKGIYRVVPEVEVFLCWMLENKKSKDDIQKIVFDNYPEHDENKPFDDYENEIKKIERICKSCGKDITGDSIMPLSDDGFVCNPTCYANMIETLCDDARIIMNDIVSDLSQHSNTKVVD